MPRCYECSKVVYPRLGFYGIVDLRTWSSGPELIKSADSGCDLCSFIRKDVEKVSAANTQRLIDRSPVVLRECNGSLILSATYSNLQFRIPECDYYQNFCVGSSSSYIMEEAFALRASHGPVLRACELLKACVLGEEDNHRLCKPCEMDPAVQASSLPRRLLDLSHGDIILTLDTQEWIAGNRATVEELSRYCTLSYRWGQGPPACMLRTQLTTDRITFLVSMPQTFQDAIIVARGLGIRFLWIDALCIVQPSAHGDYTDWNAEGPRMWLVYQNAICTISATCSNNPNGGFLGKVGTDYNPPCGISAERMANEIEEHFLLHSRMPTIYKSVVASSLNSRGWVAQERLLSRRILHFTEEGIFLECQASEIDVENDDIGVLLEESNSGEIIGPHHASLMIFGNWLAFIEHYSSSEFTMQTDRLIALSSIARCVPIERFGHEYYAGIWRSHLLKCLAWRSTAQFSVTTRESCLEIAPSWSWASVPGGVKYHTREWGEHSDSLVELIDVQTSLAEASNQYGNMKKGALKFRALLCDISLPTSGVVELDLDRPGFSDVSEGCMRLAWDEHQNLPTAMELYTVIPLGISIHSCDAGYDALVITPLPPTGEGGTDPSCGVYRRIGHVYWSLIQKMEYPCSARSRVPVWTNTLFPNATEQTIVIV